MVEGRGLRVGSFRKRERQVSARADAILIRAPLAQVLPNLLL